MKITASDWPSANKSIDRMTMSGLMMSMRCRLMRWLTKWMIGADVR